MVQVLVLSLAAELELWRSERAELKATAREPRSADKAADLKERRGS